MGLFDRIKKIFSSPDSEQKNKEEAQEQKIQHSQQESQEHLVDGQDTQKVSEQRIKKEEPVLEKIKEEKFKKTEPEDTQRKEEVVLEDSTSEIKVNDPDKAEPSSPITKKNTEANREEENTVDKEKKSLDPSEKKIKKELVDSREKERKEKEWQTKQEAKAAEEAKKKAEAQKIEEAKKKVDQEEKKQLNKSLEKTKEGFFSKLSRAVVGKSTIDAEVLDQLEETLIQSDVGVQTTLKIIDAIEARVANDKYLSTKELQGMLREEITHLMLGDKASNEIESILGNKTSGQPYVIMVVGVNGVGKTTTIGKLAYGFKKIGLNVVLGAADTFRAAAIDQIKVWGERVNVPVISQKMGSDPASVAFDTLESAKAQNADIVLIDTAGRLHNKINLMNELTKIKNVMQKVVPNAPDEVLLVLDASTGQNAIEQAKQFTKATQVNSLALTKLDGTAKGGVVIGISDQFQIPVKYIGVGEGIDHLQIFDKKAFVESLFAS